jgi:O-antigen/teichoic acid export membrane protein
VTEPLLLDWTRRGALALRRVTGEPRLRAEIGWVIGNNLGEFCIGFALLKVMTNLLGKQGFGEFKLAETAILFLASVFLSPIHESYLRDYYSVLDSGQGRRFGLLLVRWYAAVTMGCAILAGLLSLKFAQWFDISRWTTLAAGLVFLFLPWRVLRLDILNIRRERRSQMLQNIAYLTLQVGTIWAVLSFLSATPSAALLAYAGVAAIFAGVAGVPLVREVLRLPESPPASLMPIVWSFGIPYAALLVFQWTQGATDRYLLKAMIDTQTVGLYVAAYQVCGIPYLLLLKVCHSLLRPIAYERGRDLEDARGLWRADRVLLGGVALQTVLGAGMLLFYAIAGQRLLVMLTSPQFLLPTGTIVALAASRFVQSIAQFLESIFAVHHRMLSMLGFRLVGAAATVAICWYGVRWYGIFGAAAGTLLAFVIYFLCLLVGPGGWVWLVTRAHRDAREATG